MNQLLNDVLYYTHATIAAYVLIALYVQYEQMMELELMYDLVEASVLRERESNEYVEDRMALYEDFRPSYKVQNEDAEPYLELIKHADEDSHSSFKTDLEYSVHNASEYSHRKVKPFVRKLMEISQQYPRIRPYVKQLYLRSALHNVGTFISSCCFCLDTFKPIVYHEEGKLIIYPDYMKEQRSFYKLYVDGSPVSYGQFTFAPDSLGSYTFDLEYKYLDNDEVKSVCDELVVEVL